MIVLAKQVLQTADLRIDRTTKKLITEGVPRVISEADKNAVEEAIRIRERYGGKVAVITMGPPEAKEALREALAMGADEGHLLSDALFTGSDSHATANVISTAIQRIGNFDLIICGEASEDQYSFQVGPRIAEILNLPQITYAVKVDFRGNEVIAERSLEDYYEVVETKLPVLVTVSREINEPRLPTLMAIMAASKKPMKTWAAADLGLSGEELGHKGCLVDVLKSAVATGERRRVIIGGEPTEAAEKLANALIGEGAVKVG